MTRAVKRRWIKVLLIPWEKARPSPLKGAFQKAFCAYFCAVIPPRISHEPYPQSTRKTTVIYFTEILHNGRAITPTTEIELPHTDANTREKLPAASPKGPGLQHFRALAEERSSRSLDIHGLASRPPKPKNKTPQAKNKTPESQKLTFLIQDCNALIKNQPLPLLNLSIGTPEMGDATTVRVFRPDPTGGAATLTA
jgi:hypothetical protein